jgi:chemotaxis family two-component system sensor histidine kinase/response regulator PixL
MHDPIYPLFLEEAQGLLQILGSGLQDLKEHHETHQIHELRRAAHTLKGGAAMVGRSAITSLAEGLETVFQGIYCQEIVVDEDLIDLLFRGYDSLKGAILEDIQTGQPDDEATLLAGATPLLMQLAEKLGYLDLEINPAPALPQMADLGLDMVQILFSGDVAVGLERLRELLPLPDPLARVEGVRSQLETFIGIGEITSLPGFTEIAQITQDVLSLHPEHSVTIGHLALADLQAAQIMVLAGDRTQGGRCSEALRAWLHPQFPQAALGKPLPATDTVSQPFPPPDIMPPLMTLEGARQPWDQATEEAMLLQLFETEPVADLKCPQNSRFSQTLHSHPNDCPASRKIGSDSSPLPRV